MRLASPAASLLGIARSIWARATLDKAAALMIVFECILAVILYVKLEMQARRQDRPRQGDAHRQRTTEDL